MKHIQKNIGRILSLSFLLIVAMALIGVRYSKTSSPIVDVRNSILTASSGTLNPAESLDFFERAKRLEPSNISIRISLAQLHLQLATYGGGEAIHVPAAREELDDVLRRDPENMEALVLKGRLLNKLHRFPESLELANQLLNKHPNLYSACLVRVDALIELGRLDEAVERMDHILSFRPGLAAYSRVSYLRQLHGDTDGAMEAMELAVNAGSYGSMERSWALYQLGNLYLGKGNVASAQIVFDGILSETPNFSRAYTGLAHVSVLQGDLEAGVRSYRTAYDQESRPENLEGLLEIYTLQGDEANQKWILSKIDQAFISAQNMGEIVDMEYADFLADHQLRPVLALKLAKRDFKRRPDMRHARETLAWAYYANGKYDLAWRTMVPLAENHLHDAKLLYRAGKIALDAGNRSGGRALLRLSLENQLALESPTAAVDARNLLFE